MKKKFLFICLCFWLSTSFGQAPVSEGDTSLLSRLAGLATPDGKSVPTSEKDDYPLVKEIYLNDLSRLETLFERKALNPNSLNTNGTTIAFDMVERGDIKALKVFLKHGGDLKLHRIQPGLFEVALLAIDFITAGFLAKNGAETSRKDVFGRTPLETAILDNNVYLVKTFLSWGVQPTEQALKLAQDKDFQEVASLLEARLHTCRWIFKKISTTFSQIK